MNCLITGVNGFLGKFIALEIAKQYTILGLSRTNAQYNISLDKEIPSFQNQFELIIHAAGKAHCIPKSEVEKQEFYKVNVIGTQNLLEGLERDQLPKYFVFISSVAVYGQDVGYEIDENSPLHAVDPYGLSKIKAEQIIIDWCNSKNIVCTILRLPLIVGTNPPGNLGAMINAIKKGFYFNIAGGKAKKSMVLAEDVAKGIIKVAKFGGVYNLTDGNHPSFEELSYHISRHLKRGNLMSIPLWIAKIISKFGDLLGKNAPLNTIKLKKITSDLTYNDSKARENWGWKPTPVLEGFKTIE